MDGLPSEKITMNSECHICKQLNASGERELCPCCDYDGCLHTEDPIEVLDWWVFSDSPQPFTEWFIAEVEKRLWRKNKEAS